VISAAGIQAEVEALGMRVQSHLADAQRRLKCDGTSGEAVAAIVTEVAKIRCDALDDAERLLRAAFGSLPRKDRRIAEREIAALFRPRRAANDRAIAALRQAAAESAITVESMNGDFAAEIASIFS